MTTTANGSQPTMAASTKEGDMYAIASGLRGFRSTSLRVRITRRDSGMVWVRTADLLDAGTALVLNASQVSEKATSYDQQTTLVRHARGLVALGG